MKIDGQYNRIQLPQLKIDDIELFRKQLERLDIFSVKARIQIRLIKPLQNEIDSGKIKNIINSDFASKLKDRIFVLTKNLELIDGHHSLHSLAILETSDFKVKCLILDDTYENLAIKLGATTFMNKINEDENKPKTDLDRLKERQEAEMEALKKKHFQQLQTAKQKDFNKKMDESKVLSDDKLIEIWVKYSSI